MAIHDLDDWMILEVAPISSQRCTCRSADQRFTDKRIAKHYIARLQGSILYEFLALYYNYNVFISVRLHNWKQKKTLHFLFDTGFACHSFAPELGGYKFFAGLMIHPIRFIAPFEPCEESCVWGLDIYNKSDCHHVSFSDWCMMWQ